MTVARAVEAKVRAGVAAAAHLDVYGRLCRRARRPLDRGYWSDKYPRGGSAGTLRNNVAKCAASERRCIERRDARRAPCRNQLGGRYDPRRSFNHPLQLQARQDGLRSLIGAAPC